MLVVRIARMLYLGKSNKTEIMSYINLTRRDATSALKYTVCLTEDECKILLPIIRKEAERVARKVAEYDDIHESGEATTRQENKRLKYSERLSKLSGILCDMKVLIQPKKRHDTEVE